MSTLKGQKRTADELSPTVPSNSRTPVQSSSTPRIVRRHQHRRRNIAATVWGVDPAPVPGTSRTQLASTSNVPKPPFNVYKSLLRHPNLFFQFALRLPYPTMISLYAIDKEFHYRLNKSVAMREAFLQDVGIWGDADVFLFQLLLVKLDMRFSDPVLGNGIGELSHMLLTQKGLGMLYKVLTKQVKMDYDKATDILVRTYLSEDLDTDTHTWLDDELDNGVPEEEWGLLCREGWHMEGKRMDSAVDMIIMEGIRRELDVHKYYLEYVMYGCLDNHRENVPTPTVWRTGDTAGVTMKGWPSQEDRKAVLLRLEEFAKNDTEDAMEVDH
ncbi:hypothetical protein N0V94_007761 [Neodidymelliopsis sp. IMI 364377]|nr:hypothetical protein N0V94_007761 [Neodidymelliopsis sp. IMI 364377]